jgi:hypothetical protein
MHHLLKNFLLARLSIRLVLLTHDPFPGVVAKSKKVGLGVESSIGHWLVGSASCIGHGLITLSFCRDNAETGRHASLSFNYRRLPTRVAIHLICVIIVQKVHVLRNLSINSRVVPCFTSLISPKMLVCILWTQYLSRRWFLKMRPRRLIYLFWNVLCEIRLSHTKILIFELFDSSLKSSIFISELYELCVNFIYSCNFRCYIFKRFTFTKLPIFSVTTLHNILDLSRN